MKLSGGIKVVLLIVNLLILENTSRAGHLDTLDIYSQSMNKVSRCIVITPNNYDYAGKPYPVLYLLHGWSGNYAGWLSDAPQLKDHADTYQMIIVCPDGGYDSWYIDSPVDSTVRYETHLSKEVVETVDHFYHTIQSPKGRAIAGLSMGGHGALLLAIKHPDIFGAAGSMAGGLDLRPFVKNEWDLKGVLGDHRKHRDVWEANSVVNLLPNLKDQQVELIIDCGIDDFFIETNRAAHRVLLDMDYPHDYIERPGEHNGEYWGHAVDYQVFFFNDYFRKEE